MPLYFIIFENALNVMKIAGLFENLWNAILSELCIHNLVSIDAYFKPSSFQYSFYCYEE